jgi:hypothetical protein
MDDLSDVSRTHQIIINFLFLQFSNCEIITHGWSEKITHTRQMKTKFEKI